MFTFCCGYAYIKVILNIFDKPPSLVKPEDFYNNYNLKLEYEGLLCNYNVKNEKKYVESYDLLKITIYYYGNFLFYIIYYLVTII